MSELHQLETKVSRNPRAASSEDLDTLAQHFWRLAEAEQDFRTRRKLLKRASFFAGHAFKTVENGDTLRLYMTIVNKTAAVHGFPQDERRKLSQITARWLQASGADRHEIVASKKGTLAIETATIALGDADRTPTATSDHSYEAEMVASMNRGERLFFGTGSDGRYRAELRQVECVEPALLAKEYARVYSSTPTVVLRCRSGRLGLGDWAIMMQGWPGRVPKGCIELEVPPGNYKACAYSFSTSRSDSVIAVVSPTTDNPPNVVEAIDSVFA